MCATILGWALFNFIEHGRLTLGEAILIVLTIGLPILGITYRYFREKRYALNLKVSPRSAPVGRANLKLKIKARVPIAVERMNIRFVEPHNLGLIFRDAPIDKIEIAKIGPLDWRTPSNQNYVPGSDAVGGIDVVYSSPKNWGESEWLTTEIDVVCHKPWSGCLSFEARTTKRRLFARRSFSVIEDSFVASI